MEQQKLKTGNKEEPGLYTQNNSNVFSAKLGNSDIVADLEIDVHLKIGENTDLNVSSNNNNNNKSQKTKTLSTSSDDSQNLKSK